MSQTGKNDSKVNKLVARSNEVIVIKDEDSVESKVLLPSRFYYLERDIDVK